MRRADQALRAHDSKQWAAQEVGLLSDERGALTIATGIESTTKRLHRNQKGSVAILVLFMGLIFYALAAMTWNTGKVTTAKIEAQTAADSAAYSSALWMSRGVNMIAATNQQSLRAASALGVAVTTGVTGVVITARLAIQVAKVAALITNPFTLPAGIALGLLVAQDIAQFIRFIEATGWPVTPIEDIIELGAHLDKLERYQKSWADSIPEAVESQRRLLEDYYDCDIQLGLANGAGEIEAPVRRGNFATCLVPFTARYALGDALGKGSWYKSDILTAIILAQGKKTWKLSSIAGWIAGMLALQGNHYVLSTQTTITEVGPYGYGSGDPRGWEDYTANAVARKRQTNQASGQLPAYPLDFMAPGLFNKPIAPVATASAETFNSIDGFLSVSFGGFGAITALSSIYPWRVWTDWGWQWQPRLTASNLPQPELFEAMGINTTGVSSFEEILHH